MLKDKIAIVTGGTRGIGYAIVEKYLANHAVVVLCGSRQETADRAVAALKERDPSWRVEGIAPDLGSYESVKAAFDGVRERHGRIDILVNNAGMSSSEPLSEYTPELFRKVMSLNVDAAFYCARAVYDAMANPAKYGLTPEIGNQIKSAWAATEADVEAALKNEKFNRLVAGLFTANKLDARSIYDDGANSRSIAYTTKSLSAASDVDVTDDDIRAAWQQAKESYRLGEENRAVEYVLVSIEPSQADRLAGQKEVEDALLALNSQPGTDGVSASTRFLVNRVEVPASQITDRSLKAFADTAGRRHTEPRQRQIHHSQAHRQAQRHRLHPGVVPHGADARNARQRPCRSARRSFHGIAQRRQHPSGHRQHMDIARRRFP